MKRPIAIFLLLSFASAQGKDYFSSSYTEARRRFVEKTEKLKSDFKNVQTGEYRVPSRVDQDLTTNWVYLPPQRPNRKKSVELVIITSGIHGVEGYAGSALQLMFLDEGMHKVNWEQVGFLLIHAINPYGFKYNRRATENNVDLNRNFLSYEPGFKDPNTAYPHFNDFLNPEHRASWGWWTDIKHFTKSGYYVLKNSQQEFRQAVLQGQYSFPKGIFYGGGKREPQVAPLTSLIQKFGKKANRIFHMDLHTGYGVDGKLHYFGHTDYAPQVEELVNEIFRDEKINSGDQKDFYQTRGDFTKYVGKLFDDKPTVSMTFEYGTLDSQTLLGSLESLKRVRLENQGHHWGHSSKEEEKLIKKKFLRLFYPKREQWREKIMNHSRLIFPKFINRFESYQP